ncbi:unnamed protein product, partial [Ceratitis capitata]
NGCSCRLTYGLFQCPRCGGCCIFTTQFRQWWCQLACVATTTTTNHHHHHQHMQLQAHSTHGHPHPLLHAQ